MAESIPELADSLFLEALQDAAMTDPSGNPLFPSSAIKIALAESGAISGASVQFTLPLPTPILSIASPFGDEEFYAGYAPDGSEIALVKVIIPFSVFSNDGTADQAVKQRLMFSRDRRKAVYSAHGLFMVGQNTDRPAVYVTPEGFYQRNYLWHFHWTRSSGP